MKVGFEVQQVRCDQVRRRTLSARPAIRNHRVAPRWLAVGALLIAGLGVSNAQTNADPPGKEGIPASLATIPPRTWAVDAVNNELEALHHKGSYLRYRMHVVDAKGDQVRDVIESEDGTVARLIIKDGKPLTEEQDKAERQRLNAMIESPSEYYKHVKNDSSGRKIADSLMRLMPDAMIYTYVPGQPQTGKNPGMTEIVSDYEPYPKFNPPTTAAEALKGLRGRAWVDAKSKHLVRMEGTVFQGVNFGWGMLAHIYPGGKLVLEQADAGNGRWIFTHFTEQLTVRALMVKTLNINTTVDTSNFQAVPRMRYQDAIHLLLDTPLPTH